MPTRIVPVIGQALPCPRSTQVPQIAVDDGAGEEAGDDHGVDIQSLREIAVAASRQGRAPRAFSIFASTVAPV
jgi:hypothetical protein